MDGLVELKTFKVQRSEKDQKIFLRWNPPAICWTLIAEC
jgi:hypothetical protein